MPRKGLDITGNYLHPLGVIYPPIDVNAQPETVLPHWGVCVLF